MIIALAIVALASAADHGSYTFDSGSYNAVDELSIPTNKTPMLRASVPSLSSAFDDDAFTDDDFRFPTPSPVTFDDDMWTPSSGSQRRTSFLFIPVILGGLIFIAIISTILICYCAKCGCFSHRKQYLHAPLMEEQAAYVSQPHLTQANIQPAATFEVLVPADQKPGSLMTIVVPDGRQLQVMIPGAAVPGQTKIQVQFPQQQIAMQGGLDYSHI
jgi:hypothetical protein